MPWRSLARRRLSEWQPPARKWHEAALLGMLPPLFLCFALWLAARFGGEAPLAAISSLTGVSPSELFSRLPLSGGALGVAMHISFKAQRAWPAVEWASRGISLFAALVRLVRLVAGSERLPARLAPAPRVLLLLREWTGAGAAVFLAAMGGVALIAWRHLHLDIPLLGSTEDTLLAGVTLAAGLFWRLEHNRFDPRVWRFRLPDWAITLAGTHVLPQAKSGLGTRLQAAAAPGTDIIMADDLPDFRLPLDPSQPDGGSDVGVTVTGDTLRRLRDVLRSSRGRLFQEQRYRGVRVMLDLYRGPVHGTGLLEFKRLAAQFVSRARHERWSGPGFARRLLAFVQHNITYQSDADSTGYEEYGRFPLQTLLAAKGDCDCSALLDFDLLSYCGFDCALVLSEDHAWPALRRPDADPPFWHRWFPRRMALSYWHAECTSPDGGDWSTPDDTRIQSICALVAIPAMPLTDSASVEEVAF